MASTQTKSLIRVFIDSSILIAASISARGSARDLLQLGFRGQIELYISADVLEESERNLATKAPAALVAYYRFRQVLAAKQVNPRGALIVEAAKVVVAKDAPIVAAAVEARATYLATYDRKHLLSRKDEIREALGIVVMAPDEILAQHDSF